MIITKISGSAPVVVFVGPAACGKSMVLQSLVDMLRKQNLAFEPDVNYLRSVPTIGTTTEQQTHESATDKGSLELYKENCEDFKSVITSNAVGDNNNKRALKGSTDQILVNVKKSIDGNEIIIKLLEAPGEHFFSVSNPEKGINEELLNLFSGEREFPIYYVILLDLHTVHAGGFTLEVSATLRDQYSQRVVDIIHAGYKTGNKDRLVFLYNKSDLNRGTVKIERIMSDFYPAIEHASTKRSLFGKVKPSVLPYIAGRNFRAKDIEGEPIPVYSVDRSCTKCAEALWKELNPQKSLFKFF
ncbi:MAG: hypothetical protein J6C59_00330 [Muribaculaceae bacterium]|nr:hypothetical protein [Muribaculaceae bacterium]